MTDTQKLKIACEAMEISIAASSVRESRWEEILPKALAAISIDVSPEIEPKKWEIIYIGDNLFKSYARCDELFTYKEVLNVREVLEGET